MQQTCVLHTQNSMTFLYCLLKKAPQKAGSKRRQKGSKKAAIKVAQKFIPEPVLLLS